jgi:hemoglobin
MQIVKIGKATFLSSGQAESEEEGILLKGNLHIPITVEVLDELLNEAGESNVSLYDQIGGEKAIEIAAVIFYRKVLNDHHICRFFYFTDMDSQLLKQRTFLTYAFGGPNIYTGKDLRSAHAMFVKMGLDDTHFDAVIGHLISTFEEINVPAKLINKAVAICESVRDQVLGR